MAGAAIGAGFLAWIAGRRVVDPTETDWVMQGDWRVHFLGWQFFRQEPWQWPPGRIAGYYHAPDGTAVGLTDSIPVVAFILKPLSDVLPPVIQYLGPWLLICFALQGFFGVLLIRHWTPRASLQLLGAALFVLVPTLLNRVQHPALCAHWLLLWAIWLYLVTGRGRPARRAAQALLGVTAGLVHPYLAAMVLILLGAIFCRDVLRGPGRVRSIIGFLAVTAAVLAGWWASGLFTVAGNIATANMAIEGLDYFSANLLAPVTPSGWSTILPEVPTGAPGQAFEGFHYFGLGILLVMVAALATFLRRRGTLPGRGLAPLIAAASLCGVYALSPRVTFGDLVVLDVTHPALAASALFRVSGRFLWPTVYVTLTVAIGLCVARMPWRWSAALLGLAIVIQLVDLGGIHREWRRTSRSEAFHSHRQVLRSTVWRIALPNYDHMVLYLPQQCGPAPAAYEWPAHWAATHGMTINAGDVARFDAARRDMYCADLEARVAAGVVSDDAIYLVSPSLLEHFRSRASVPLVCTTLDAIPVCVTERSFAAWRHLVP